MKSAGELRAARRRIGAAIDRNPGCARGLFCAPGAHVLEHGPQGGPVLIALIDADPASLFDHWYGIAGDWTGDGPEARIAALPMIGAPDAATLAARLAQALAARPAAHRARDRVRRRKTFRQAVEALGLMIATHDRSEARRSAVDRWRWADHPARPVLLALRTRRPSLDNPHHWPAWICGAGDADGAVADIADPEDPLAAAVRDFGPPGMFTRPGVLRHRRADRLPETFAFVGGQPGPRPWLYGYVVAGSSGCAMHGTVESPVFFDTVRLAPLFAFLKDDLPALARCEDAPLLVRHGDDLAGLDQQSPRTARPGEARLAARIAAHSPSCPAAGDEQGPQSVHHNGIGFP